MTTFCEDLPINEPLRFLRSTVTSFNCSLGLGSQESTLNVDLVDDCDPDVIDIAGSFSPLANPPVQVGAPVYFPDNNGVMPFNFGGVLSSWTIQQSSGGKTYNVKVSDPRQLLENTVVIIDSFINKPIKGVNYFNVYAYYESDILNGNCNVFGTSRSNERGMPYKKIIDALADINPIICSPTGYNFVIDFNSFPGKKLNSRGVPEWYRVTGPSISILQLLTDICETLAYEFYVELYYINGKNVISVGLIDLNAPPAPFGAIVSSYNGSATDLSYGQELRNEKTKMILFGEQVHYLTKVNNFEYFFGEDFNPNTNVLEPIVPYTVDDCGFWIRKRIESLNISLNKPLTLNGNGPYEISEMDIRCAMGSHEMWKNRVFDPDSKGSFNEAIRNNWSDLINSPKLMIDNIGNIGAAANAAANAALAGNIISKVAADAIVANQLNRAEVKSNDNEVVEDLEKIRAFVSNLGSTYYGKQFFAKLNQKICWYREGDENNTEIHYTDIPTPAGGWIEQGPVIGLNDPDLGFFRQDDYRVGCFARFNTSGEGANPEEEKLGIPDNSGWNKDDTNPSSSPNGG